MFEIGNNLREARLRNRVDLVEAEQDTKIRSKYLAAMETEDFDVLPGPVYTRGFLRTYSRYLGLDAQLYVDEYNARFGRFEDADEPPVLGRQLDRGRRIPTLRAMLFVSLVALALIAWLGLRSDAGSPVRKGTPAPDKPVAAAVAGASFHDRHVVAPPRAPAGRARHAAGHAARLTVLAARGPSWIEVRRGGRSGQVLFSGTLPRGAARSFSAARLYLTAGLPSVLELRIPGQRLVPTASSTRGFLVTPVRITQR